MGEEAGPGRHRPKAEGACLIWCRGRSRRRLVQIGGILSAIVLAGCHLPDRGARAQAGDLRITHAVAWGLPDDSVAIIGFRMENRGARADTLVGVDSPVALVTLHDVASVGGFRRMIDVKNVPLPAGGRIMLGAGRRHLMLDRVDSAVWARARIPLALHFAHSGTLTISVPILRVTEALEELEGK